MTENAMEGRFRLDLGGGETDTLPIGFADRRDEERLAELLGTGEQLRVRLTPAMDTDIEGHAVRRIELDALVRLQAGEGDDTEGHAISLRFPSAEEADRFRTRMLATGALVGTLVVGSVAMQSLPSNPSQGIAQPGTAPAGAAAAQATTTMVNSGRRDSLSDVGAASEAGAASDDESIDRSGRTGPKIR